MGTGIRGEQRGEGRSGAHGRPGGKGPRRRSVRSTAVLYRRRRLGAVAVLAAGSGLLTAVLSPRGPVTGAEALALLGAGLLLGLAAGRTLGSRWAALAAPVLHVAAFEVGRLGAMGPTVDGIDLGGFFGVAAFVVGRGLYGAVVVFPMVVGALLGAARARQREGGAAWRRDRAAGSGISARAGAGLWARRAGIAAGAAGVVALAVLIAWPASTPPVVDEAGEKVPGSIAALERVSLGGKEQWISLRGRSEDLPVVLYLTGGPGGSDLGYSRVLFADLAEDFIVVGWDQRGTGKSYRSLDPVSSLTLDQAVFDAVALSEYLCSRFDEERIYLVGESWGTILGIMAAERRPDLYHAYVGSGQMVDVRETDRGTYRALLEHAERTGDDDLARRLREHGEPPYQDLLAYGLVEQNWERLTDFTPPAAYVERGTSAGLGPMNVLAQEYDFIEKANVVRGLLDMFAVMYPQLQEVDLRRDVPRLDVPVYMVAGAHELESRAALVPEYYELLEAPSKSLVEFEESGHAPAFQEFERFHRLMVDTVLAETYPER